MSAEIVKLEIDNDPREIISVLNEIIEYAKKGEVESVIMIVMRPDGSFFTKSSRYHNCLEVIGALTCAIDDVVKASEK